MVSGMVSINLNGEEKEIEAIIFDMDNTLFDLVEAKKKACEKIVKYLERNDADELYDYFLREGVNYENPENISNYLDDRNIQDRDIHEKCQEIYEKEKLENISPYENVEKTLEELKDSELKLAIVSGANQKNVEARLKKAGLYSYFDFIVSRDETGKAKPDPKSLLKTLKKLNVNPPKSLIVGDSKKRDIKPGKEIGMITAHAEYGDKNFSEKVEKEANISLDKISNLVELINFQ